MDSGRGTGGANRSAASAAVRAPSYTTIRSTTPVEASLPESSLKKWIMLFGALNTTLSPVSMNAICLTPLT